ncbi:hypothetical protein [Intestinibacter sp.]
MKKILYLTNLYYVAKGRNYYDEDLYITEKLKDHFDVVLCHPQNAEAFEDYVDLIVFRNTGGVNSFKEVYDNFKQRVTNKKLNIFNDFVGKADMCGKDYLLELDKIGYPVIPTIDNKNDLQLLPNCDKFVIKPKDGCDSIGLEFLTKEELLKRDLDDGLMLIQPAIDFKYELSFYFINDQFQYAMYAPNKEERWRLEKYEPTAKEIEFAKKFINWNDIKKGIQRVDACKTKEDELLLVELEDLNPYLSILELDDDTRDNFINNLIVQLNKA